MTAETTTGTIRLALVDDHAILRQGLRSLLEREDDLVVVGEASSEPEAEAMVARVHQHAPEARIEGFVVQPMLRRSGAYELAVGMRTGDTFGPLIRFAHGAATDVGRVRSGNEDSFLVAEALFAVADGMGGHAGGDVASATHAAGRSCRPCQAPPCR